MATDPAHGRVLSAGAAPAWRIHTLARSPAQPAGPRADAIRVLATELRGCGGQWMES